MDDQNKNRKRAKCLSSIAKKTFTWLKGTYRRCQEAFWRLTTCSENRADRVARLSQSTSAFRFSSLPLPLPISQRPVFNNIL